MGKITGIIILCIVGLVGVAIAIGLIQAADQRESERTQLRIEMDAMKSVCSANTDPDMVEAETQKFDRALEQSLLDLGEQARLTAAWNNMLNLSGCGSIARNQPKKRR